MKEALRLLSVRQPWAHLLVHGPKDVENRDWATRYRGPILIHAGQAAGVPERERTAAMIRKGDLDPNARLFFGGIVGRVQLVDCREGIRSRWASAGSVHWKVESAESLPFVKMKGMVGLLHAQWPQRPSGGAVAEACSVLAGDFADGARVGESADDEDDFDDDVAAADDDSDDAERSDVDIADKSVEEVLCAFRAVLVEGGGARKDVLRDVTRKLGYARMGHRIEAALRGLLRAAVRRGIAVPDGDDLLLATKSIEDYSLEDLRERIRGELRSGERIERELLVQRVARALGFARTGHVIEERMRSAFNSAIRQGELEADGAGVVRRIG